MTYQIHWKSKNLYNSKSENNYDINSRKDRIVRAPNLEFSLQKGSTKSSYAQIENRIEMCLPGYMPYTIYKSRNLQVANYMTRLKAFQTMNILEQEESLCTNTTTPLRSKNERFSKTRF